MLRLRSLLPVSVGYAAGYVMGARSGRPAYDRMLAALGKHAEGYGLTPGRATATEKANEEIADQRDRVRDGSAPVGRPDEGREHGPTVVP